MDASMKKHSYPGEFRSAIARAKKVLTAAGFPWSVTSGRYTPFFNEQKTTSGVRVTRIGCSESITLHIYGRFSDDRETMRWVQALAVATLRDAGLPFDDRGWLACGRDAARAQKSHAVEAAL